MAPRLKPWLAPAAFVVLAAAGAYAVPRALRLPVNARRLPATSGADQEASTAALRWRANNDALTVLRYRLALAPAFRAVPDSGPSFALAIDAPDTLLPRLDSLIRPALAGEWSARQFGVTKVGLGVVIRMLLPAHRDSAATPPPGNADLYWVLPDSTDRTSCIAVVPLWPALLTGLEHEPVAERSKWIGSQLGPCGLIARYGVPGPRVRHWLGNRRYDFAASPSTNAGGTPNWLEFYLLSRQPVQRWVWGNLYQLRPVTLACLDAEEEACRKAVAEGDGDLPDDSAASIVRAPRPPGFGAIPLIGGEHFLYDVAAATGPERFEDFWGTDLPVDSALSLALGAPVGRWTAAWQRHSLPQPPRGAMPGLTDAGLSIIVAAAAVGLLMLGARRRTVR